MGKNYKSIGSTERKSMLQYNVHIHVSGSGIEFRNTFIRSSFIGVVF